ncbi:hypothetical protein WMY93_000111 [Mugilogobius chulae]|uniref:C-type lectin domain-containing protein n=1 Tax=Mugilogobius chulae TaxID=88201 RepID=A0AAW0PZY7_9GOBI
MDQVYYNEEMETWTHPNEPIYMNENCNEYSGMTTAVPKKQQTGPCLSTVTSKNNVLAEESCGFPAVVIGLLSALLVAAVIFIVMSTNWTESKRECEEHEATLVIISSPEEQGFVGTLSRKKGQNVWIGLTDRETENKWKWVNGDRVNTTYWTSPQPDNWGGAEHCGEIRDHGHSWNDNQCSAKKLSICEKSIRDCAD